MNHDATLAPLPPLACDCHTHVFLDASRFPFAAQRRYTPPPASIEALESLHRSLGVERVVLVQPSVYGRDNAATLHALRTLGPQRARGVAVIDEATSDEELDAMHALGVRGVRVNLEVDGERDAGRARDWLRRTALRVSPLGWHVQLFASMPLLGACADLMQELPVPLVFDHYAGAQARLGLSQPGMREVLALVDSGRAWVKLSAPYRVTTEPGEQGLEALTKLFLRCNPERMVWGSDWPHPRPGIRPRPTDVCPPYEVDHARVLGDLRQWIGEPALADRVFAGNPARLYDFPLEAAVR